MLVYFSMIGLFDEVSLLFETSLSEELQGGAGRQEMIDQAGAAIGIDDQQAVEIGFFRAYSGMGGFWLSTFTFDPGCEGSGGCRGQVLAPFSLVLAQRLVIAFFAAGHDGEQVMFAAAHIPLKERTAAMGVNVEILRIALDDQFVLAVAVKIGELVTLPVTGAETDAVGGILGFDQMVVDSRAHVAHVDATKEAMPVSIVGLGLPQLYQAGLFTGFNSIDGVMHAQHFFVLVIHFRIAHEEIAPEPAAHELEDGIAFLIL